MKKRKKKKRKEEEEDYDLTINSKSALTNEEAEQYRKQAVKNGISQEDAQRGLDTLDLAKRIANEKIEENESSGVAKLKELWEDENRKEYKKDHDSVIKNSHSAIKSFVGEKSFNENVKGTVYEINPFLINLGNSLHKAMKDDNIKFGEVFNKKKEETLESLFD